MRLYLAGLAASATPAVRLYLAGLAASATPAVRLYLAGLAAGATGRGGRYMQVSAPILHQPAPFRQPSDQSQGLSMLTSLQKLTAEAQRAQSFTLAYSLRPLRLGGEMTFLQ